MLVLTLFGFLAGAATALSPCALPVLPVVFSAGVTGGRKRPLGIATGLALSFTFATVLFVYLISLLGLPDSTLRYIAVTVLFFFGVSLLIPQLGDRIEAWISRMTARSAGRVQQATAGDPDAEGGFWSGILIGSGLGFLYAPCAGPILAGVITVSASQSFSTGRLTIALAYGLGSAVTFYALMLGGRKFIAPLIKRSRGLQIGMGISMVLVALAMSAQLDVRFQTTIASSLPAFLVNPTGAIEETSAAQKQLASINNRKVISAQGETELEEGRSLPIIGDAPDFVGNQKWFNTANGQPLTIDDLRGKVVLVDFWTYTCINCIRTFPYLKAWDERYRDKGLVIVGMHTPEFTFEKSAKNVQAAIDQNEIRYPVAQDNDFKTWDAYENQYWPAKYLIDTRGRIRYTHFGEGKYDVTEQAIRKLLTESGQRVFGEEAAGNIEAETQSDFRITKETYLGSRRAAGFDGRPPTEGTSNYGTKPLALDASTARLGGRWKIDRESATAAGKDSFLDFRTVARRTFLVLGSAGDKPRRMQVLLDGKPISNAEAGRDVKNGYVTIAEQRLYRLVELPGIETRKLTLRPEPGISGYAFTFG